MCDSDSSEDEVTRDREEVTTEMNKIDEDQDENIKPTLYKRKPRCKGAKDEPKRVLKL